MQDNSPEISKVHLDKALENLDHFEIGDNIRRAFQIFRKSFSRFLLFFVIYIVASLFGLMIPYVGQMASSVYILPAFTAGIAIYCYYLDYGVDNDFSVIFSMFRNFLPIITANVIVMTLLLLAFLPIRSEITGIMENVQSGMADPGELDRLIREIPRGKLFLTIGLYSFVNFVFVFVNYFIGLFNLSGVQSILYSLQFTVRKFPILFIYFVISVILAFSGVFIFGVGVMITFPLIYPLIYSAFTDLTQFDAFYLEYIKEKDESNIEMFR